MSKYVVGVIAFILVVAGGYYVLKHRASTPAGKSPASSQQSAPSAATSTYATTTFTVVYPSSFTVDPNFSNTEVNPKKPIAGVKLTIPMAMATGTNLMADSFVSTEQLPRAKKCTGDIYLAANVTPTTQTISGKTYSVASSTGVGAGNRYDETVYAILGSSPCTAIRYFVHSTNIGNYPDGTVRAYDSGVLRFVFDTIRDSVQTH